NPEPVPASATAPHHADCRGGQRARHEATAGRHEEDRAMTEPMARVTCDLSISIDGYSAGLNQTEQRPFGDDGGDGWGDKLHAWFAEGPAEHPAEFARMMTAKAFIMGRNMFGPVRGEWDQQWKGWWGDN